MVDQLLATFGRQGTLVILWSLPNTEGAEALKSCQAYAAI